MKLKPLDLEDVRKEVFKWIVGGPANESEEFFDFVMCEVKQRIKQACEFYLRYKDKPELLMKEQEWVLKLEVPVNKLGDILEYSRNDWRLVWQNKDEYNEWLFKITFAQVLK